MKRCVSSWRTSFAAVRCRSVAAAGDSLFFCFAKSKVSKRKGDPAVCVPPLRCGQPAVLASSGVPLELAALRQSRALIHLKLRSSAHTEGVGSEFGFGCMEPAMRAQFSYIFYSKKLYRVFREFSYCTNWQYIQSQPNPHAAFEGI